MLQGKDAEKYAKAEEIAKGEPKHDANHINPKGLYPDQAYHGEKLYHYGSPKVYNDPNAKMYHNRVPGSVTENGFHIYYIDSHGNYIGNNTTNVKDIVTMSYVMLNADADVTAGAINRSEQLQGFLWTALNPEPTWVISDLYHNQYSTDRFPYSGNTENGVQYHCNDQNFYNEYNAAKREGVQFFTHPIPYSAKGCRFDEEAYNAAVSDWEDSDPETRGNAPGTEDQDGSGRYKYYTCDGHNGSDGKPGLHCSYGFRDVAVYVTVLTKDDVFTAANNGYVINYLVPKDYICSEWEIKTVSVMPPNSTPYKPWIDKFLSYGGYQNQNMVDWTDRLYTQDWYDAYGVQVFSASVELGTGAGSLTSEEIAQIMESYDGDVDAQRQAFVDFAMSMVGRIPYYWGGHASVQGYDGNDFGKIIAADYKGRNRKGLDCSGFVSWVYWSTFGVKPGQTTATLTDSLGLVPTSAKYLVPGDLGLQATPGSSKNHIGIFVGWSEQGRPLWVHCNSSAGNVSCNDSNCFRLYYSLR